jgi:hypothetical protein
VQVQAASASCLARLARVHRIASVVAKAGAIPRLVRLLGEASQKTKEAVATALVNLSGKEAGYQHEFHESGALPGLVALLSGGGELLSLSGCATLANLALDPEAPGAVREAGAIPPLVRLLRASTPPNVLLYAARAVKNLTGPLHQFAGNMASLAAAGAVPQLVRLLGPGSSVDLLACVTGTLASLGHAEDMMLAISAAGAIPLLLQLLDSPVCGNAAGVLQELACSVDNAAAISAGGALPKLVRMLGRNFPSEVHEQAAGLLANLCRPEAGLDGAVASANAIPALVALLRSGSKSRPQPDRPSDAGTYAQLFAVGALKNLARGSAEHLAAMKAAGAVPLLERLMARAACRSAD